jgi:replication factor C subunit 3/5
MDSEAGIYDRTVVQEIITEFSKTKQINSNLLIQKAIIIHDADQLSKGAQQALRRTMEKFSANVRIIFVASSLSKFIPAIRSRCVTIRVPLSDDAYVCILISLTL